MRDVTLSIRDKDYPFFLELINKLDFVSIKETKTIKASASKKKFLSELRKSVDEVNLAKRDKVKLKSADQLLNEL